jgi:hypothetical protein
MRSRVLRVFAISCSNSGNRASRKAIFAFLRFAALSSIVPAFSVDELVVGYLQIRLIIVNSEFQRSQVQ